ncbi:MAG: hypothetical protein V1872_06090 [bacterium]
MDIILLKISKTLLREGFKTSWQNPFFAWVNATSLQPTVSKEKTDSILYIFDLPIPKITPFNLAIIALVISHDFVMVELFFYYCRELEDAGEADVAAINNIYTHHAAFITPKLAEYFNDIARRFNLQWDTEYDVYIEDSALVQFDAKVKDIYKY